MPSRDRGVIKLAKVSKRLSKVAMRELSPQTRRLSFDEVALGYTAAEAMEEASRCLQCRTKPCVEGCPVQVPIPEFIGSIAAGEFEEAYLTILQQNRLPAICGRVCPQENQCEGRCVRGLKGEPVAIGRLERFAADEMNTSIKPYPHRQHSSAHEKNNKRVAVVGSGPAGLTCAGELATRGYDVTLFEALHALGGVLMYGIPEFRLPKRIVDREIEQLLELGVTCHRNVVVGRSMTVDELLEEDFDAVFLGSGAGLPRFFGIEGESLNGVLTANEFLTRVNLMKAHQYPLSATPVRIGSRVAVVGGGNVAMDAARTALRLGANEVYIVYRRGEEELPARREEIHHAKEEGIQFKLLMNPIRLHGEDGWVRSMECVQMVLGEPDASGRRRPIENPDHTFMIEVDSVIIAIGQGPNPLLTQTTPGLSVQRWGGIVVEETTMRTSKPGVYAGGDVVTGAATVISAMGAGKQAAAAIHEYLQQHS